MIFLLLVLLNSETVYAKNFSPARIAVVQDKHINDLKWDNEFSKIRTVNSGLGLQHSIMLFGVYYRSGWKLTFQNKEIPLNDRGGFRLEIPISKSERVFEFEAIGPKGEIEKEIIEIGSVKKSMEKSIGHIKGDRNIIDDVTPIEPEPKKFFLVPGIGYSSISYTQSGITDYSMSAVTAKVSINYTLVPKVWDFGFSTYYTAMQLSKSTAEKMNFLGINLRFGYLIPNISTEWFLSIYGGWYYTTTFVTSNSFGYFNLSGPQLYPSIRKVLGNGDIIGAYFKYSPIASSLSLLSLSNRELGGGISYVRLLPNDHSIGATLDISNIFLTFENIITKTNSLTFGIQYGL